MTTLFISDLHLTEDDTKKLALLQHFIEVQACRADALYILGDFFEYWLGDDIDTELTAAVIEIFKPLKAFKTKIYIMRGNRDFLLGRSFAEQLGAEVISDPTIINLYGRATLLTHGDRLCVDDQSFQFFLKVVNYPLIQKIFKALPPAWRKKIALYLRMKSKNSTMKKSVAIMDVVPREVQRMFNLYRVSQMIHGHTHKPGIHLFKNKDFSLCQRITLSDWEGSGHVLVCRPNHTLKLLSFNVT